MRKVAPGYGLGDEIPVRNHGTPSDPNKDVGSKTAVVESVGPKKPRALDLFCGAGGASMGLHRAGFDVTGVDIKPQPRYPFEFIQADAMTYPLEGFDFIWASPPCQAWSESTPIESRSKHPKLIDPVRKRLIASGIPFCIENVDGARHELKSNLRLCGTQFGLNVWRHRWFEAPMLDFPLLPPCFHSGHPIVVSGSAHGRGEASIPEMIEALQVPWMGIRSEVRQAIPPAYSEFIGKQALQFLRVASEARS